MKTMLQIGLSCIIMKSQVKIKKGRKPESCQAPGVWRQPRSGQITFWRLKQFQFFCSSVCLGYLPNFINSVYCYNKTTFISPNPVMTVPLCMWWGFMIFVVVVAQWPALILDFIPFFFFFFFFPYTFRTVQEGLKHHLVFISNLQAHWKLLQTPSSTVQ